MRDNAMNPNPERDERVRQIRERADMPTHWTPTWADVNYLLTLLDSPAAGASYEKLAHEILSEYNSADDRGLLRDKVAEGFATVANDAATRMRDRCVEKVNELTEPERRKLEFETGATGQRCRDRIRFSNEIITALQSLTLEGEQEKSK